MSEKRPKESSEVERPLTESVSRVNYCESELYAVDKRKQQVQPDVPKKRPKLQLEANWENRLRPRAENEPIILEEDIAEVYIAVEENGESSSKRKEEENQVDKKRTDSPKPKEGLFEPRTQSTPVIAYEKLGTAYRRNLEYVGPSQSYGNTYQVYYHPTNFEHLALEIFDRRKAIYRVNFQGFNLIAHEPRQLLTLKEWVISGAKQELIRREYLRDTGIDLGYMEPLNVSAIEVERAANKR
ncbi:14765_t:CDS:2, partial [Dentiscutata heterogama]